MTSGIITVVEHRRGVADRRRETCSFRGCGNPAVFSVMRLLPNVGGNPLRVLLAYCATHYELRTQFDSDGTAA